MYKFPLLPFLGTVLFLQACRGITPGGPSSGPDVVSVQDARFGAKGDLRTCTDAQTNIASTVLISPAECNFTQRDVNKWVQVPLAGDNLGTGLSAQIVSVQDSQHATLSVAARAMTTSATKSYTDLVIKMPTAGSGTNLVYSLRTPLIPDQVGSTLTITGGIGFDIGTFAVLAVDYTGVATLSASPGTVGSSGGTATSPLTTTIATGDYTAIAAAASYACAHPHTTIVFPPGNYYLEQYRIDGGVNANSVTDITWTTCRGTTVLGYGAVISSNGSFRRLTDHGANYSWENSVSPFRLVKVVDFVIQGFELNGNVDKMTHPAGTYEGQDYGIVTTSSMKVTIRDVNTHHWPTDGIIVGLLAASSNAADRIVHLENVWSHNNGRMGLTISNANGVTAINYRCSQIGIGFTGGYGGHPPENCVDIEPPVPGDVPTGNILFSGGYMANAIGALFTVAPSESTDVTVDGVMFDCAMSGITIIRTCTNGGLGGIDAKRTLLKKSTYYGSVAAGFGCGGHNFNAARERIDIVNNRIILTAISQLNCNANDNRVRPIHFVGNHVYVTGTATAANAALNLDHVQEVSENDFFVSKNAKYAGAVKVVNYTDTESVHDNVYSTDLTNPADPYAVNYTGVCYWRNERSANPEYFLATPNGGTGCF